MGNASEANKIDLPDAKKSDNLNIHGKASAATHDNVDAGAGKVKHHGDLDKDSIGSISKALEDTGHVKLNLESELKINKIIDETMNSKVDSFTSAHRVTESEALELGLKWLGDGYKQVGPPDRGIFRSADGTKQFRMDSNSLLGGHAPKEPHVHLEMVAPNGKDLFNQNHLILKGRND